MKTLLIAFIIIVVLFKIFKAFSKNIKEDYEDIKIGLDNKFSTIINQLNDYCYKGEGTITFNNKRTFNLYKRGSCQIIVFVYGAGNLNVKWNFKYFNREIKYEENIRQARSLSNEQQILISKNLIEGFLENYNKEKAEIDSSGVPEKVLGRTKSEMESIRNFTDKL